MSSWFTHGFFVASAATLVQVGRSVSVDVPSTLIATGLVGLGLAFLSLVYYKRWEIARPDEWQLLIRDGKLVHAGVGACHFRGLFDNIVRFPSCIHKVNFTVEQVTSEMQGVVVTGFALWSVHREGDGPWRAYKSLRLRDKDGDGVVDAQDGSQHIRDMAQSIIRISIAQQTLTSCLTKRDEIRQAVREQMMQQLPGWGVWLETVEISDVRVSSSSLFSDLQAEFRAGQRLTAERVKLATDRRLQEEQIQADLSKERLKAEAATNKAIAVAEQRLKKEEKEADLLATTQRVQMQRLTLEREMKLAQIKSDHEVTQQQALYDQEVAHAKVAAEVAVEKLRDQRLAQLSDRQMAVMQMSTTKEIYSNVSNVRINSFPAGEAASSTPAALLPGLAALSQQWEVVQQAHTGDQA